MNKIYIKLVAISLALILSVSVVVMSTYAWFVLSGNPVATGIQVAVGGGNTILIAPDITQVVEGTTYHYPGAFSDKMNFSQQKSYEYLKEVGGLTPVSTIDGVNWFLPDYYDFSDDEVREGKVATGQLKDVADFQLDDMLMHANLSPDDSDKIEEGSYIYLDFWVVSPGGDYTLRVSTGDDSGGSFLIDLLQPTAGEDETGYTLAYPESQAAALARVGFLANPVRLTDDTMLHYQSSIYFDERYTSLRGLYMEPNVGSVELDSNRFMIYEPNGDSHPDGAAAAGTYVETKPVALIGGVPTAVSVPDRVTVQKTSLWADAANGAGTAIEQRFQAAVLGMDQSAMDASEISEAFYGTYLQGQLSPYVAKGDFIKRTADLYKYGERATAEQLAALDSAGATDDVYIIKLEKNVPQRIRMFIWLEGQDVDCVNGIGSASFAVNIEFAGSSE